MQKVASLFLKANNDRGYFQVVVNTQEDYDFMVKSGWVASVNDLEKDTGGMSEEERSLRDEYHALTGENIGGRASLDTIRKKVEKARNDNQG